MAAIPHADAARAVSCGDGAAVLTALADGALALLDGRAVSDCPHPGRGRAAQQWVNGYALFMAVGHLRGSSIAALFHVEPDGVTAQASRSSAAWRAVERDFLTITWPTTLPVTWLACALRRDPRALRVQASRLGLLRG